MPKKQFLIEFVWGCILVHEKNSTDNIYYPLKDTLGRSYPIDKYITDGISMYIREHYTPFMKKENGEIYEVEDLFGSTVKKMCYLIAHLATFEEKARFLEVVAPVLLLDNLRELEKRLNTYILASKIEVS